MSEQPAETVWTRTGMLLEEMAAAGMHPELHKTQSKGGFTWSFAWRETYRADKRWSYGETAHEAVERGHARWAAEWEARQE